MVYLKLKRELLLCKPEQTIITKSCDAAEKQAIAKYNGGKNIFVPQIVSNRSFALDRAISEP